MKFGKLAIAIICLLAAVPISGADTKRSDRRVTALIAHLQKNGRLPESIPGEGITTLPRDVYETIRGFNYEECIDLAKINGIFPGLAVESACRVVWPLPTGDSEAMERLQNGGFDRAYVVQFAAGMVSIGGPITLSNNLRIEPNYISQVDENSGPMPNDPDLPSQYALVKINVLPLWERGITGSPEARIFILDTGISIHNPDLAHVNPFLSRTFADPDPLEDDFWHGSHVAGIACALGNNEFGISGVMQFCDLISLKVAQIIGFGINKYPVMTIDNIIRALAYLGTLSYDGPTFVNMSLGQFLQSDELERAIAALEDRVFFAAASGNFGADIPHTPCRLSEKYRHVACVAALDQCGGSC